MSTQATVLSEKPQKGIRNLGQPDPPTPATPAQHTPHDIQAYRNSREQRLADMWATRKNPPPLVFPDFEAMDLENLPDSFMIAVIGSRRSGKSYVTNWALQQLQQSKDRQFTHIFLISPTDSGFKPSIPAKYRFKDMSTLEHIVATQRKIMKHNKKCQKKGDMYKSRVCVVIDDCATGIGENLKTSKTLESLCLNGRHIGHPIDPMKGNGVSVFFLSQSLTRINRASRLNVDCMWFNHISSYKEMETIMDEFGFYTDLTRKGKSYGKQLYQHLVTSKKFRFISVNCFQQEKTRPEQYMYTIDAGDEPKKRLFGNKSDEESEDSGDE